MRKQGLQLKRITLHSAAGYCLIPMLYFLPLLLMRSAEKNFTGFLSDARFTPIAVITAVCILVFYYLEFAFFSKTVPVKRDMILFLLAAAFSILVPYRTDQSFLSGLHLVTAFLMFFFLQKAIFLVLSAEQKLLQYDIILCMFCAFLCFTAGQITGLAEAVYGSGSAILLTRLKEKSK